MVDRFANADVQLLLVHTLPEQARFARFLQSLSRLCKRKLRGFAGPVIATPFGYSHPIRHEPQHRFRRPPLIAASPTLAYIVNDHFV
jgi:hypothetical protein